jgi:para-aminobenzoate synthetase/4-amino-4-deoxychorismate lyase
LTENERSDKGFEVRNLHFGIEAECDARKIAAIHEYILSGDTYQVNFTDRLRFDFSGFPESMLKAWRAS